VQFNKFNFAENCKSKTTDVPTNVIHWDNQTPQFAVSADGIPFAAYFPQAVSAFGQVSTFVLYSLSIASHMI